MRNVTRPSLAISGETTCGVCGPRPPRPSCPKPGTLDKNTAATTASNRLKGFIARLLRETAAWGYRPPSSARISACCALAFADPLPLFPVFNVASSIGVDPFPFGRFGSAPHTSELQSLAYLVCRLLLE